MQKKVPTQKNEKEKQGKREIWTFGIASLLNDFGANMIYPIWPIFLTTVLGANMSVLGLVDGLGDALVSLSQAASGYASDRLKRRKIFIWLGYLLGALSRIGYALVTVWQQVIPFRIIDRAGKIRDSPRDAIVADQSNEKNRGDHFGLIKGLDKAGGVIGIILCILFINFVGYQTFFMLAAIPSVIAAVLVYTIVKEKKQSKIKIFKGIKLKYLSRDYKIFLALSALFAIGSFSYSFLLVFANKTTFPTEFVPILYLIYVIFAAAFSLPFGKLADKIGRKKVMMIALALWALTCIIFFTTTAWWAIIITFIIYGLHHASLLPVQATYVSELAPEKFRASALGGYQMVIGICALPASVIAGVLWDTMGISVPFMLSFGLTAIAMIMLLFVKETEIKKK